MWLLLQYNYCLLWSIFCPCCVTVISFVAVISDVAVLAKIVSSSLTKPSAKFEQKTVPKTRAKTPFYCFC